MRASATKSFRIGPVVAGCLISGLVTAILLLALPAAGAEEHVITGTVLLGFAFGWALLAILSVRFTDQPQRWAAVPAAFMALVGGGLIIFAPGDEALGASGWVWSPLLIALVVWMTVQTRRHLRSRAGRWLLYPVFAVLALAAVGGGYETLQESIDRGAHAMPGELIDVGGHRLHLDCTGSGSPTVVLEPGLGEASAVMSEWIAPAVADTTQVCVYDRAGRGWSEAASGPQDGVEVATDLHTLLRRAQIEGPYVLVGHSLGGIYMLNFAHRYPDQMAGLVLLDSMNPEQPDMLSETAGVDAVSQLLPSLARLGIGRLIFDPENGSPPAQARSFRDELAEMSTALEQAGELKSLGDRPLAVVTAPEEAQDGWRALQDELATLSTDSVHRVVPGATHASLITDQGDAAESSDAIRDVVESVRAARPRSAQA
jgi:pimeloyl-ACP methyl ester carboxylesterase